MGHATSSPARQGFIEIVSRGIGYSNDTPDGSHADV